MKYYAIKAELEEISQEMVFEETAPFIAILTSKEWDTMRPAFSLDIDVEIEDSEIMMTEAIINLDCITGSMYIPDRKNIATKRWKFRFALYKKGIIFVEDGNYVLEAVLGIQKSKKWKMPCLERFLFDFLNYSIKDDLILMETYDHALDLVENAILADKIEIDGIELNRIRNYMIDLKEHFEQMIDFCELLLENENDLFQDENLRFFNLLVGKLERLNEKSASVRDHTMQIREIYKTHLDIKQNRITTVLTVITTIFLPLTLIAGWYGMNFVNMPELKWKYGYLVAILVSLITVTVSLFIFKKKKWL